MPRDTAGGGVLYFYSTIVFNPLVLRALPLYFLMETPRNATGRGRGRGLKEAFQFWYKDRFYTSPLCFATQNIGERPKKQLFLRRGVERFVVHSSQQREERTKKRCRSCRAFRLVASVVVGVCGTRFAQTVLALFPPSSLRLCCPIKAELTSPFSGFIQLSFLTPPSCGHLPYILRCKTQGRRVRFNILALLSF